LKADPLGKLLRREAIVAEIAGTPGSKPLTMHNGAASIHL
jgi:hypothetical protein